MKNIAAVFLIGAVLAGCESSTPFGACIGAFDDKKPDVEYKLSVRNTVVGIIFVETVVVPVVVVANKTLCPVGLTQHAENKAAPARQ